MGSPLFKMSKKLTQYVFLILTISLLSGCGFHLKNSYQLPSKLQKLQLQSSDQYSEISRLVTATLLQYDATLTKEPNAPVIRLGKEKFERGTLSLFSSGQVAEYELIYALNYSVIIENKEPMSFDIAIRRDYLDDPQTAQAKSREREQLLREIRQQAAIQIVQQLSQLN